jgi:alpha-1,6-mannosyltransferase
VETFGLAALEALASGTSVVAARTGALPELLGADGPGPDPGQVGPGLTAHPFGAAMAEATAAVLAWDPAERRARARARAACYPWSVTVDGMLGVHRLDGIGAGRLEALA